MTLFELLKLVRTLRAMQRKYYKLDARTDRDAKMEALVTSKILERQLDQVLNECGLEGQNLSAVEIKPAEPWKKS
jgi:hypothetical protein